MYIYIHTHINICIYICLYIHKCILKNPNIRNRREDRGNFGQRQLHTQSSAQQNCYHATIHATNLYVAACVDCVLAYDILSIDCKNYRPLLQKSPIKDTIFFKVDL